MSQLGFNGGIQTVSEPNRIEGYEKKRRLPPWAEFQLGPFNSRQSGWGLARRVLNRRFHRVQCPSSDHLLLYIRFCASASKETVEGENSEITFHAAYPPRLHSASDCSRARSIHDCVGRQAGVAQTRRESHRVSVNSSVSATLLRQPDSIHHLLLTEKICHRAKPGPLWTLPKMHPSSARRLIGSRRATGSCRPMTHMDRHATHATTKSGTSRLAFPSVRCLEATLRLCNGPCPLHMTAPAGCRASTAAIPAQPYEWSKKDPSVTGSRNAGHRRRRIPSHLSRSCTPPIRSDPITQLIPTSCVLLARRVCSCSTTVFHPRTRGIYLLSLGYTEWSTEQRLT